MTSVVAPAPKSRSTAVATFMGWWLTAFFRRHMTGLRVARWGQPAAIGSAPIVVYMNHPGWWDPVIGFLLARRLLPGHPCYAPIEAEMLRRYAIFARLGAFGVETGGRQGATAFLEAADAILAEPGRSLWVTAQGRFADVRERPLGLKAGVARLAERAPNATFLPLAIETAFWSERGAEALVAFGPPMAGAVLSAMPRKARIAHLEAMLGATMDRLAEDVIAREPDRFVTVVAGKVGIGGVYDGWRRVAAMARGRGFDPAHGARLPPAGGYS